MAMCQKYNEYNYFRLSRKSSKAEKVVMYFVIKNYKIERIEFHFL